MFEKLIDQGVRLGSGDYGIRGKSSRPTKDDWKLGLSKKKIKSDGWALWIRQAHSTLAAFWQAFDVAMATVDLAKEPLPDSPTRERLKPRCLFLLKNIERTLTTTGSQRVDVESFVMIYPLPGDWYGMIDQLETFGSEWEAILRADAQRMSRAAFLIKAKLSKTEFYRRLKGNELIGMTKIEGTNDYLIPRNLLD